MGDRNKNKNMRISIWLSQAERNSQTYFLAFGFRSERARVTGSSSTHCLSAALLIFGGLPLGFFTFSGCVAADSTGAKVDVLVVRLIWTEGVVMVPENELVGIAVRVGGTRGSIGTVGIEDGKCMIEVGGATDMGRGVGVVDMGEKGGSVGAWVR